MKIEFDHEGPLLTYGANHDDWMAHIILTLKQNTGGYHNHYTVLPRPRGGGLLGSGDDGERKRHYTIIFILPPMAEALFQLDEPEFWELSGMNYYVQRLGLTDLRGTL